MQDSVFTKIIKGEIPSHKIYEDDYTFAFLDIHPVTPGHTLVVPKRQVEFVWDLPDEEYQRLLAACKTIALHLRDKLNVPYVGTKIEGVDVPHAHIHLIPFSSVAEFHGEADMDAEPDHEDLERLAKDLAIIL
jgi:histidine triad (HIT) family protein